MEFPLMMMTALNRRDSLELLDILHARSKGSKAVLDLAEKTFQRAEMLAELDPQSPKASELYKRASELMGIATELPH